MRYTVNLKNNGLGQIVNNSPFIINEEALGFVFQLTKGDMAGDLYVNVVNGDKERCIRVEGDCIFLPPESLTEGILSMTVALTLNGDTLKKWEVEPLYVRMLASDVTAAPVIMELVARIAEVERKLNAHLGVFDGYTVL